MAGPRRGGHPRRRAGLGGADTDGDDDGTRGRACGRLGSDPHLGRPPPGQLGPAGPTGAAVRGPCPPAGWHEGHHGHTPASLTARETYPLPLAPGTRWEQPPTPTASFKRSPARGEARPPRAWWSRRRGALPPADRGPWRPRGPTHGAGRRPQAGVPYGPGQQGVEGVQPVVHVLVAAGLQQDAPVLRAHGERVGGLQRGPP